MIMRKPMKSLTIGSGDLMRKWTEMETRCNAAAKYAFETERLPIGIGIVRAVMRAMREPTAEMIKAGHEACFAESISLAEAYPAMIDAASPPEE